MPSVIALLWVNYVLSFSTMACAIFDLTSAIRDRSSKNPSSAPSVSSLLFMAWGLWKSLASALLYIDVSVRPSFEVLFFFGHLLTRFIFLKRHSFDKLHQLL
jgi:hypothetical protein